MYHLGTRCTSPHPVSPHASVVRNVLGGHVINHEDPALRASVDSTVQYMCDDGYWVGLDPEFNYFT